jgi:hypothetical protein
VVEQEVAGRTTAHRGVVPLLTEMVPVGLPEYSGLTLAVKTTASSLPYETGLGETETDGELLAWVMVNGSADEVAPPSALPPLKLAVTE